MQVNQQLSLQAQQCTGETSHHRMTTSSPPSLKDSPHMEPITHALKQSRTEEIGIMNCHILGL